jgi:hypothetical protein
MLGVDRAVLASDTTMLIDPHPIGGLLRPEESDQFRRIVSVSLASWSEFFDLADPPAILATVRKREARQRLGEGAVVLAKSVLGGLPHEYSRAPQPRLSEDGVSAEYHQQSSIAESPNSHSNVCRSQEKSAHLRIPNRTRPMVKVQDPHTFPILTGS